MVAAQGHELLSEAESSAGASAAYLPSVHIVGHLLACLGKPAAATALLLHQARELASAGLTRHAEQCQRQVLAVRAAHLGARHPDVADSLAEVAAMLEHHDQLRGAAQLFSRAAAVRLEPAQEDGGDGEEEEAGGPAADLLLEAGFACLAQGRFGAAEALFARSLSAFMVHRPADHPDVAMACSTLANVWRCAPKGSLPKRPPAGLGTGGRAPLPLLRRSLKARKASLGDEHPDTLDAGHRLVEHLLAMKKPDYKAAADTLKGMVDVLERVWGATTHKDLPRLYRSMEALRETQAGLARQEAKKNKKASKGSAANKKPPLPPPPGDDAAYWRAKRLTGRRYEVGVAVVSVRDVSCKTPFVTIGLGGESRSSAAPPQSLPDFTEPQKTESSDEKSDDDSGGRPSRKLVGASRIVGLHGSYTLHADDAEDMLTIAVRGWDLDPATDIVGTVDLRLADLPAVPRNRAGTGSTPPELSWHLLTSPDGVADGTHGAVQLGVRVTANPAGVAVAEFASSSPAVAVLRVQLQTGAFGGGGLRAVSTTNAWPTPKRDGVGGGGQAFLFLGSPPPAPQRARTTRSGTLRCPAAWKTWGHSFLTKPSATSLPTKGRSSRSARSSASTGGQKASFTRPPSPP